VTAFTRITASSNVRPALTFWALSLLALAIAACIYQRGLQGDFLFDDLANLPALGAFGPIDNWTAFSRYITSGIADPTGRPLAMLSFLIDARNWPADPYPFKRTNLILHLVNALLLAMLLRRLGRASNVTAPYSDKAAALGASLWLLHPLFVSTTLYVVQREAMLPATFALLGLLGYCRGRKLIASGKYRGLWVAFGSIAIATALGVASKANGVLLPMLAGLVEYLLLSPNDPIKGSIRAQFFRLRMAVLILPSIAVLAWLAFIGIRIALHGVPEFRAWTLGERLLTEARVVCDYLALLWVPHPYTAGLFNDSVAVSKSVLQPFSTLICILFLGALFAAAIALRHRAPAIALAILFYFCGHLLESTVVPLELYYEHRNYLPAMLMFWPLALWLTGDGALPMLRRGLAVLLPLLLAGMTFLNADLWGNAGDQALVWAEKNPESPRAQAYAAAAERALGRPDLAAARMQRVHVASNELIQIALNEVGAQCEIGQVDGEALARARSALRSSRTAGRLYYEWMSQAIERVQAGSACPGLGPIEIGSLLDAMDENPNTLRYAGWRQDNLGLRGVLAMTRKDVPAALEDFNRALDQQPNAATALAQAAQLGTAGYPEAALSHLDHFDALPEPPARHDWSMASVHAWLLRRQGFMRGEVAHLRGVLEQDVKDKREKAP